MITTLIRILALLMLSGCSNSDRAETPYMEVVQNDGSEFSSGHIIVSEDGGEILLNIRSNYPWQAECDAEWVNVSLHYDNGDNSIKIDVGRAEQSRSCAMAIYLTDFPQMRSSVDIIQHVSPQETPSNDDPLTPENNPEQPPQPEVPPTDTPTDTPSDNPNDNPEQIPEEEQPSQSGDYVKINKIAQLTEGKYYIGGYQDGTLHLACGGMQSGHCKTAEYIFTDSGALTPATEQKAVNINLESATENGYYIRFEEGYLSATAAGAGKLAFTSKKSKYWIFSPHADGGFVVRESGDVDVQLIISPKAKDGALLRSVAGDEEGNAIILFRKNR